MPLDSCLKSCFASNQVTGLSRGKKSFRADLDKAGGNGFDKTAGRRGVFPGKRKRRSLPPGSLVSFTFQPCFYFTFLFLKFLWLHPWHVEVLGLGVK